MSKFKSIRKFLVIAALAVAPLASQAGVIISVGFAPPILPVYAQPICPGDGYLWTPGYWAYGPGGYYWVPGVWVQPPSVGLLWTPGYWGWGGGAYLFHAGYWGPHVGFYGGINYGFGYGGNGFYGGEWRGGHFAYNTAFAHVNTTVIHNTYVNRVTINNVSNHTSFNGGSGGIQARPNEQESRFEHENHVQPTGAQQQHFQQAGTNRANFASANGGHPQVAAMARPGAANTAVPARGGFGGSAARPAANNPGARPNTAGGFQNNRPAAAPQARPQENRPQAQAQPQARPQMEARPQAPQAPRQEAPRAQPQAQPHAQVAPHAAGGEHHH
jgi:hypothetical protein